VVRVTGLYLDRWWTEAEETEKSEKAEESEKKEKSEVDVEIVKVKLKRSVPYERYQLVVVTEQDVGDKKEFELPVFECANVLRQQGRFGVVKATNVEIHEISAIGVAKADGNELSETLRSQTSKSILMGYTFLSPRYSVKLQKIHHTRLEVLDASIEQAYVQVMVAEDHSLNNMIVKITNSNRQYLRVKLPTNLIAIWSTFVNSEPVSPVTNSDGAVLIPLTSTMMSGSTYTGKDDASTVELVYLTRHTKLGDQGDLKIQLPSLDVPINLLSTEILFPYDLLPTFNSGTLKRIPNFSVAAPTPVKNIKKKIVIPKDYSFLSSQYILEDDETAGIANVHVRLPQVGAPYRFEKLLVLDESLVVEVDYRSLGVVESQSWQLWGFFGVVFIGLIVYICKR